MAAGSADVTLRAWIPSVYPPIAADMVGNSTVGVTASTGSRTGRYAHQNAGACERWLSSRLGAVRRRVRVRDPEDSPGQGGRPPANRGGPAALAGNTGHVPRQPRLSAPPTRPARANAEATAPLITPPL